MDYGRLHYTKPINVSRKYCFVPPKHTFCPFIQYSLHRISWNFLWGYLVLFTACRVQKTSIQFVVEGGKVTLMQGLGVMQGPVHDCRRYSRIPSLHFASSWFLAFALTGYIWSTLNLGTELWFTPKNRHNLARIFDTQRLADHLALKTILWKARARAGKG